MKYFFILILILLQSCKQYIPKEIPESQAYFLDGFQDKAFFKTFHQFPILEARAFAPISIKQLNELLEDDKNFDGFGAPCFEPNLGFQIVLPDKSIKTILVSIDCSQVFIYENNNKKVNILSPIGKDKFKAFMHQLFKR